MLKIHKLHVCGYKDKLPDGAIVINTTSRSKDFGKAFSPFMNQGPIELAGMVAKNVENFYQFSKVYSKHLNDFEGWKAWRKKGFSDTFAHRYPMGKGEKPEFAWREKDLDWQTNPHFKLGIETCRHMIYIPAYRQKLERYCMRQVDWVIGMLHLSDVYLWDFDGYLTDATYENIVRDPTKSMGHAFVLKKFIADRLHIGF